MEEKELPTCISASVSNPGLCWHSYTGCHRSGKPDPLSPTLEKPHFGANYRRIQKVFSPMHVPVGICDGGIHDGDPLSSETQPMHLLLLSLP